MQYSCASGIVGINVGDNTQTYLQGSNTQQQVKWDAATYDNARLLVNGKLRTCGLQLTTTNGEMVGSINQGKYLRVADADGNIEIADVTVTTDFLAEWPLASETLTDGSRTTYEMLPQALQVVLIVIHRVVSLFQSQQQVYPYTGTAVLGYRVSIIDSVSRLLLVQRLSMLLAE